MHRNLYILSILACLTVSSLFAQEPGPSSAPTTGGRSTAKPQSGPTEDFTKLAVDRTVLKPWLAGSQLGKLDTPNYTREYVRLMWRHGDPIDVYIVFPHGAKKPRVALYLYSYPSEIDKFQDDGWCTRATSKGIAAVAFISALTGERYRMRPMREWFVSELQESMASTAHDVQLILDYLAARGDLNVDKVGMFGQGSGASIAILAAAADPRITALDLLNPWGDWPDWLKSSPVVPDDERAKYLTPEFLDKAAVVDPVTYLPQLKDRAYRVQQIMDDPENPPMARDKIAAAVPQDRLAQFKDASAHRDAWKVTGISGWIAAHLQPAAQGTAGGATGVLQ
jgi:hypothetical protein